MIYWTSYVGHDSLTDDQLTFPPYCSDHGLAKLFLISDFIVSCRTLNAQGTFLHKPTLSTCCTIV